MAIFKPGAIVGGISGSVGGATFVNSRGSSVLRKRKTRNGRRSQGSVNQSAILQNSITRWRNFSAENKTLWNNAASNATFANRLGQQRNLSGYQYFLKLQTFYFSDFPPVYIVDPPNVTVQFTSSVASGIAVDIQTTGAPDIAQFNIKGMLLYRNTPIKFVNFYKNIANLSAPTGFAFDFTFLWEEVFPLPVLGQYVALQYLSVSNNAPTGQIFEQIIETTA